MAPWWALDITSGSLRSPSSAHHGTNKIIKKQKIKFQNAFIKTVKT